MLIAGRFDFLKILIVFYSGTKQVVELSYCVWVHNYLLTLHYYFATHMPPSLPLPCALVYLRVQLSIPYFLVDAVFLIVVKALHLVHQAEMIRQIVVVHLKVVLVPVTVTGGGAAPTLLTALS